MDIVIVLLAVTLTGMLAAHVYGGGEAREVRITQGNGLPHDVPLGHARTIRIDGPLGTTIIEIETGRARVVSSPCSGKICIRSGWLEDAGDATACVPNRVSLLMLGGHAAFDAVTF